MQILKISLPLQYINNLKQKEIMTTTEKRINDLKHAMEIELINNFPNGDLWNKMSDELDELQKKPNTFEILSSILN